MTCGLPDVVRIALQDRLEKDWIIRPASRVLSDDVGSSPSSLVNRNRWWDPRFEALDYRPDYSGLHTQKRQQDEGSFRNRLFPEQ